MQASRDNSTTACKTEYRLAYHGPRSCLSSKIEGPFGVSYDADQLSENPSASAHSSGNRGARVGPVFFHRRTKLRELANAESQGKSFWTTAFDQEARAKIGFAIAEASRSDPDVATAGIERPGGLPAANGRRMVRPARSGRRRQRLPRVARKNAGPVHSVHDRGGLRRRF